MGEPANLALELSVAVGDEIVSAPNSELRKIIRQAMERIAKRKPGTGRLVYDKATRTIVARSRGGDRPVLRIDPEDADLCHYRN